jgi:ribonuclease HI
MANIDEHPHWVRMRFKRNKVWMAVDDSGQPLIEKGKALIKYQLDQPHQYWVHPHSVAPLDEEAQAVRRPAGVAAKRPAGKPGSPRRASQKPDGPVQADGSINIYTDGACSGNPGPAGIGVVLLYQGHRKEISRPIGIATNNIAELQAIKAGLESVKNRDLPVVLYTDSSYALGLLTQGWKARQNQELVRQVRRLVEQFRHLRIIKVQGHAGHPENERADRLAVKAIQAGP